MRIELILIFLFIICCSSVSADLMTDSVINNTVLDAKIFVDLNMSYEKLVNLNNISFTNMNYSPYLHYYSMNFTGTSFEGNLSQFPAYNSSTSVVEPNRIEHHIDCSVDYNFTGKIRYAFSLNPSNECADVVLVRWLLDDGGVYEYALSSLDLSCSSGALVVNLSEIVCPAVGSNVLEVMFPDTSTGGGGGGGSSGTTDDDSSNFTELTETTSDSSTDNAWSVNSADPQKNPFRVNVNYPNEWVLDTEVEVRVKSFDIANKLYAPPRIDFLLDIGGIVYLDYITEADGTVVAKFHVEDYVTLGFKVITVVVEDQRTFEYDIHLEVVGDPLPDSTVEEEWWESMKIWFYIVGIFVFMVVTLLIIVALSHDKKRN